MTRLISPSAAAVLALLSGPVLAATTTFSDYDTGNKPQTITGPTGDQIKFSYTSEGQVATMRVCGASCFDGDDQVTEYQYNAHGQPSSVTLADGRVRQIEYDELGFPASVTLSAGALSLSELQQVDTLGRLVSTTDARGVTTSFDNYDAAGRPLQITSASNAPGESLTTHYSYYPEGQLRQRVVNPGGGAGQTVTTEVTQLTLAGFGRYAPAEMVISWPTASGTEQVRRTYSYDAVGRLVSETLHTTDPADGCRAPHSHRSFCQTSARRIWQDSGRFPTLAS